MDELNALDTTKTCDFDTEEKCYCDVEVDNSIEAEINIMYFSESSGSEFEQFSKMVEK